MADAQKKLRPWCRLHNDIRNNVKLAKLDPSDRWCYVVFLTLENDGSLDNDPPEKWLARQFDLDLSDYQAMTHRLQNAGLLDDDLRVVNFESRQYMNQANAERQQRFRNKKKGVTRNGTRGVNRNGGAVTAPETDVSEREFYPDPYAASSGGDGSYAGGAS